MVETTRNTHMQSYCELCTLVIYIGNAYISVQSSDNCLVMSKLAFEGLLCLGTEFSSPNSS